MSYRRKAMDFGECKALPATRVKRLRLYFPLLFKHCHLNAGASPIFGNLQFYLKNSLEFCILLHNVFVINVIK